MKFGIMGMLFSKMFEKTVYEYTSKAVPQIDMRRFKKKHMAEYRAMVARTPSVGSMKENMFAPVMYLACYGFTYYKADPEHITMEVFDGMIDAICKCDTMEDAEKELTAMSRKVSKVITKSYLEGYPVENVKYSWLTKQYIKSKRDKFFVAHVEFVKE